KRKLTERELEEIVMEIQNGEYKDENDYDFIESEGSETEDLEKTDIVEDDVFETFTAQNPEEKASLFSNKITGGQPAVPHSFPHQVALQIEVPLGTAFCGGSILSETVILTAAHCVETVKTAKVIVGAHNLQNDEPTTQTFNSTRFIVHEEWSMLFKHNDIALIILEQNIEFNDNVKKIELPVDGETVADGQEATVSGWGITEDGSQTVSPELNYVTANILPLRECNKFYFGLLDNTQICLNGENGKSSCRGDSGGALITKSESKTVQIGIVSFGIIFGCEIGYPGTTVEQQSNQVTELAAESPELKHSNPDHPPLFLAAAQNLQKCWTYL
ncbi:hypothetical protein RN001_001463, partial [Aquatica leii]